MGWDDALLDNCFATLGLTADWTTHMRTTRGWDLVSLPAQDPSVQPLPDFVASGVQVPCTSAVYSIGVRLVSGVMSTAFLLNAATVCASARLICFVSPPRVAVPDDDDVSLLNIPASGRVPPLWLSDSGAPPSIVAVTARLRVVLLPSIGL